MSDSERSNRLFGAMVHQGFQLAFLYCAVGLALELSHRFLPQGLYESVAGAIYGLPLRLLVELGLQPALINAVATGRLPGWVAAAAIPALGVAAILVFSFTLATLYRFALLVVSLRHR